MYDFYYPNHRYCLNKSWFKFKRRHRLAIAIHKQTKIISIYYHGTWYSESGFKLLKPPLTDRQKNWIKTLVDIDD
jgi:hypothetical protein